MIEHNGYSYGNFDMTQNYVAPPSPPPSPPASTGGNTKNQTSGNGSSNTSTNSGGGIPDFIPFIP